MSNYLILKTFLGFSAFSSAKCCVRLNIHHDPWSFQIDFYRLKVFREIICFIFAIVHQSNTLLTAYRKDGKMVSNGTSLANRYQYIKETHRSTVVKVGRLRFKTLVSHENLLVVFGHSVFQPNLLFKIVSEEKLEGCVYAMNASS